MGIQYGGSRERPRYVPSAKSLICLLRQLRRWSTSVEVGGSKVKWRHRSENGGRGNYRKKKSQARQRALFFLELEEFSPSFLFFSFSGEERNCQTAHNLLPPQTAHGSCKKRKGKKRRGEKERGDLHAPACLPAFNPVHLTPSFSSEPRFLPPAEGILIFGYYFLFCRLSFRPRRKGQSRISSSQFYPPFSLDFPSSFLFFSLSFCTGGKSPLLCDLSCANGTLVSSFGKKLFGNTAN